MQPLNAIDAIAPAFTRTHEVLFRPFRAGRSWKLAASQYVALAGAMFIPFPLFFLFTPRLPLPPPVRLVLDLIALIYTLILLVVLYLGARMEMVCFAMIVSRGKFIAPMWRRYGARVWPWIALKVLVGTAWTLLLGAIFFVPLMHMFAAFPLPPQLNGALIPPPGSPAGTPPDPAQIQAVLQPYVQAIFALEFALLGLVFLLKIPSTLLGDFVLPFLALEEISIVTAVRRGLAVCLADPVQVILYLILKLILFFIGYIAGNIAIGFSMMPFFILFGIGAAVAGVSFSHHGSSAPGLFAIALLAALGLLFVVWIVYASIGVFGYLLALLEAYAVYFLGGRYPLLGNLLEPGPGQPFTPPPVFPSPEEQEDSDGGPPMPMDPAVA